MNRSRSGNGTEIEITTAVRGCRKTIHFPIEGPYFGLFGIVSNKPWPQHVHGLSMVRSSKTPKRKAEAERLEALRVQGELAVFGDGYQPRTEEELAEPEVWWSKHYQWLKDRGYLLRPRYAPDWVPSWKGTKKDSLLCEDSRTLEV